MPCPLNCHQIRPHFPPLRSSSGGVARCVHIARTGMTAAGKSGQAYALEVLNPAMKHVTERPFVDPQAAARKLLELAASIEPVQDGRIHIEKIKLPHPLHAPGK